MLMLLKLVFLDSLTLRFIVTKSTILSVPTTAMYSFD